MIVSINEEEDLKTERIIREEIEAKNKLSEVPSETQKEFMRNWLNSFIVSWYNA